MAIHDIEKLKQAHGNEEVVRKGEKKEQTKSPQHFYDNNIAQIKSETNTTHTQPVVIWRENELGSSWYPDS